MTNVGFATLDVVPDLAGFSKKLSRGVKGALGVGGLGAAFGVASFIKSSVELEAAYSRTMGQMRVATQASGKEMKQLDALAISLGKETIFSANEASGAMLELAKNGISPAVIQAGALSSALTLAAAGSTDLTFAATTMGNAINAFGLKGKDSASVAAALAGAANASSASVESLAQGLQQAATGANDAGLNVQETTAILAAFANAGISGSDAGTSLKTMLSRLVPTTSKAAGAMAKFGLKFTDANGEFISAVAIAKELKTGLGDLSAEERSLALNAIFGSDARRAATILTNEGAEGLKKYIKATSDQTAAEKMAKANMEGTAGAIERLSGAWETARLEFGKAIAPTVQKFLDFVSSKIDDVSPKLTEFGDWFNKEGAPAISDFVDEMRPLAKDLLPAAGSALGVVRDFAKAALPFVRDLVEAFNDMPGWAKKALVGGAVGGTLFVKFGGGSLVKGLADDLLSRGGSPARPLYVWTVNGGGPGTPGGKPGSLLNKLGIFGAVLAPAAIGLKELHDFHRPTNAPLASLGGGGINDWLHEKGIFGDSEADKRLERQKEFVAKLGQEWLSTKAKANDYNMFVRNKLPGELKFTVLGWPVAQKQARDYLATLLEIRDLHMDTRLDRAGGSGTAAGSGVTPPTPHGRPHDRGINVTVEKVVAQDVNSLLTDLQGRTWRASAGGVN